MAPRLKPTRQGTLLPILWLPALLVAGCGTRGTDGRQPAPQIALLEAVDVSQREPGTLLRYAGQAYRLQRTLRQGDTLHVDVFAHEIDPVYSGPRITSRNEFNRTVGRFLQRTRAGLNAPRTRTDVALEKIGERADGISGPLVVAILTDGGIELRDAQAMKRISDAVRRLAGNPRVKSVVMAGVLPEWRLRWESWLSPLGDRAQVRGTDDAGTALSAGLVAARGGAR